MLVVTWNVLEDENIPHGDYRHADPALLRAGARRQLLVDIIAGFGADVIALQEVDAALWEALEATGKWITHFTTKTDGSPDGCLLLVRADIVAESIYHRTFPFNDGTGHVAQAAVIDGVTFVNTHIKWADEDGHNPVGLNQVQLLLKWLGEATRVVLLGDFNSQPGEEVRQYILDAGYTNLVGDNMTAFINQRPRSLDMVAVREVAGWCLALDEVEGIPVKACPSDHIPVQAVLVP